MSDLDVRRFTAVVLAIVTVVAIWFVGFGGPARSTVDRDMRDLGVVSRNPIPAADPLPDEDGCTTSYNGSGGVTVCIRGQEAQRTDA